MLPPLNLDRVRDNVRKAETEDLLDRITLYRPGMEDAALEIIEAELRRREISSETIRQHAERHAHVLRGEHGAARACSACRRPAIAGAWGWQRLWGAIPVFPRFHYYCARHLPALSARGSGTPPAAPNS